jgi:endonuclease YncB( thermonuclease family)
MEKIQSSPSRNFEDLLDKRRNKKLYNVDVDTIPDVPYQGEFTPVRVYNVIDGDSIKVLYRYGKRFHKISIRVNGVDTPEVSRGSDLEKKAGAIVGKIVRDLVLEKIIIVKFIKWDKYGGRLVGDVYLPDGKDTLCNFLITNKLGHSYSGKVKKTPWTDEELHYIVNSEH